MERIKRNDVMVRLDEMKKKIETAGAASKSAIADCAAAVSRSNGQLAHALQPVKDAKDGQPKK